MNENMEEYKPTFLNYFTKNEGICKRTIFSEQQIFEIDERKFKMSGTTGVELCEIKGEEIIDAIKQEITELSFDNMDQVGCDEPGRCDAGDIILSGATVKDEITIKEEDVKMSMSDWPGLYESERLKNSEKYEDVKSSVDGQFTSDLNNYNGLDCSYQTNNRSNLVSHIKDTNDMNGALHKCLKCGYQTRCKSALTLHKRVKHDKNAAVYKCAHCIYETKYRGNFMRHVSEQHKENLVMYKCAHCTYEARRKDRLTRHVRTEHNKSAAICAAIYKCSCCTFETGYKNNLTKHIREQHEKNVMIYKCLHCTFETKYKHGLAEHIKGKHKNEVVYECSHCRYKTNCKLNLTRHNRREHGKDKILYECSNCAYKTKYKNHLVRHVGDYHVKKEVAYKCTKCSFQTEYKYNFKVHKKIHLLPQPIGRVYRCSKCNFKSNHWPSLARHNTMKHNAVRAYPEQRRDSSSLSLTST